MTRILFVSFPEPGHFNPTARVARAAAGLGAEIGFFSLQGDVAERLANAGVNARTSFPESAGVHGAERDGRAAPFWERVRRGGPWYRRWLRYVLLDQVAQQLPALEAFVTSFSPDIVCTDPLAYAAVIAAERSRIPWACVSPLLVGAVPTDWHCEYTDILTGFAPDLKKLLGDHGIDARLRIADVVSPYLNTLFTTDELTPRALSGNDYAELIGAAVSTAGEGASSVTFPWKELEGDRKRLYLASGTQFPFPPALITAVADASVALGIQLVAAGPAAVAALAGRTDVIVTPFAPQLELLAKVDAMISHGGANSVLEALSRGKPIGVFPLGHEQPIQAMIVTHAGVGLTLDESHFRTERMTETLRVLVDDGALKARAEALSRGLTGGATRAAERLVAVAQRYGKR